MRNLGLAIAKSVFVEKPGGITIQNSIVDSQLKITIADNIKGINEEIEQKIFDRLFTMQAVEKGTGLRLTIARQIVEYRHRGAIAVRSRLGLGTEFEIVLPLGKY